MHTHASLGSTEPSYRRLSARRPVANDQQVAHLHVNYVCLPFLAPSIQPRMQKLPRVTRMKDLEVDGDSKERAWLA